MNIAKSFVWFAVTAATLSAYLAAGRPSQRIMLEDFKTHIRKLNSHQFASDVPAKERESLKRIAANFSQPDDSWAAILQLWLAEEQDFVELLWWRKDDSETRAFIVSLEWCMIAIPKKGVEAWPASVHNYESMSQRFETGERNKRLDEIDFVRQNQKFVASQLSAILSANKLKMAERYKPVAESK